MGCTSKDFSSCSAFLRLLVALMVAHRPRSRLYRRLWTSLRPVEEVERSGAGAAGAWPSPGACGACHAAEVMSSHGRRNGSKGISKAFSTWR